MTDKTHSSTALLGRTALALLAAGLLAACSTTAPDGPAPTDPPRVGADTDGHGCMASAGYQWCARTDRCERPWELARKHDFAPASFNGYCRFGAPGK